MTCCSRLVRVLEESQNLEEACGADTRIVISSLCEDRISTMTESSASPIDGHNERGQQQQEHYPLFPGHPGTSKDTNAKNYLILDKGERDILLTKTLKDPNSFHQRLSLSWAFLVAARVQSEQT